VNETKTPGIMRKRTDSNSFSSESGLFAALLERAFIEKENRFKKKFSYFYERNWEWERERKSYFD
jgi:hypothetical protein